MSTTPNMTLVLPTPEVTLGPAWASELNTALELVDSHDHSSGHGVQVSPSGLNINDTLPFNSEDATELNSASFDNLVAAPSTSRAVYVKGGDLYYRNNAGVEVQVTNGITIAGTQGSITNLGPYTGPPSGTSSAVFSTTNLDFTWYFDGVKPAAQNTGDVRLYPFDGSAAYTFAVTLKSPTALASNYSVTLPTTAPTQAGVWSVSTAGVLSNGVALGTESAPGLAFNGDANTGIWSAGANQVNVSTDGTKRLSLSTTALISTLPLSLPAGAAATPSYSFTGDENTGIYNAGADTLGFACGAVGQMFLGSNGQLDVLTSVVINGDTDTGMYSGGANVLSFSAGGNNRLNVKTSGIDIGTNGSFTAPALTFNSDTDTGLYSPSGNEIGITCAGTRLATFDSNGMEFNTTAGGAFRVSTATGSFTTTGGAGGSVTVTVPNHAVGIIGSVKDNSLGAADRVPLSSLSSAAGLPVTAFEHYFHRTGTNQIQIVTSLDNGGSGGANTGHYYLLFFYV